MYSAPAVSYPVGRSRFQGYLLGLTCLIGIISGLLWHYQADAGGWRQWLFSFGFLGIFSVALLVWRQSALGRLSWDGQTWNWTCGAVSVCGVLTVHLDLQSCLVLCLHLDSGASIWLWPERGAEGVRWNSLRQAIFSRADRL